MKTIASLLVGVVSAGVCASVYAEPTLEERVAALEKKVAELEKQSRGSTPAQGDKGKVAEAKKGVIFQDGFEQGVSGWLEEVRYSPPKGKIANHQYFKVGPWEKYRAAKSLTTELGEIKAVEGKRFLTGANEAKGVVLVNSKAPNTVSADIGWRLVHYFSVKSPISLAGMKLPVASMKFHMIIPDKKERNGNLLAMIQFGYYPEKGSTNAFTLIKTVAKNTEGWEELELDLSSVPKDQKIHFCFRYICADSRIASSPGIQLDDIAIYDDGQ